MMQSETEFVTAICANGLTDANIQSLFNAFDSDGDGYIEAGEVQSFYTNLGFRRAIPSRTLEDMVKAVDANGDGKLSYDEFAYALSMGA